MVQKQVTPRGSWGRRPRATPPDPRLPRWGLAGCRQLDPSHPALVTCEDAEVEPCRRDGHGFCHAGIELLGKGRVLGKVSTDCQPEEGLEAHRHAWPSRVELGIHDLRSWGRNWSRKVRETRSLRNRPGIISRCFRNHGPSCGKVS